MVQMTQPPNDDPHVRAATAKAIANLLLPLCKPVENEILLDTAYRKRMRPVPEEVAGAAAKRFAELMRDKGYSIPDDKQVAAWAYLNLADLLWNPMGETEQYQWLLKVK